MLKLLQISGITFILSIFAMGIIGFNGLLFVTTFTLFIIATVLNIARMWKGENVSDTVTDYTFNKGIQYLRNKKIIKSIITLMIYPMCIIGISLAIIDLIYMWWMVLE